MTWACNLTVTACFLGSPQSAHSPIPKLSGMYQDMRQLLGEAILAKQKHIHETPFLITQDRHSIYQSNSNSSVPRYFEGICYASSANQPPLRWPGCLAELNLASKRCPLSGYINKSVYTRQQNILVVFMAVIKQNYVQPITFARCGKLDAEISTPVSIKPTGVTRMSAGSTFGGELASIQPCMICILLY